jgi:murein DD-endopeptidase MepM/ murein hydrolase activator NlpD
MIKKRVLATTLALLGSLATPLAGQMPSGWDPPLELRVPKAPQLVAAGGEFIAGYELHVTNLSSTTFMIQRLEVLGVTAPAQGDTLRLLALEDMGLRNTLRRPGLGANPTDTQALGPGLRAIVHVWLELDERPVGPMQLEHHLTVRQVLRPEEGPGEAPTEEAEEPSGQQETDAEPPAPRTLHLVGAMVPLNTQPPVLLGPPLRGGPWLTLNGPSNFSGHRRAAIPIGGEARISQRFAIDYVRLFDNGRTWRDDQLVNDNYSCYGADVLAVADGVVVSTKNGIPENVPGISSRAVPITLETVGGNYVILDVGEGRYVFYAHLIPGSLRVAVGDRVHKGDVLGLVGNSGNSTEPHLHIHVADASSPLAAEGIPFHIDAFDLIGRGAFWSKERALEPERREGEVPLQNRVIEFPE